MMMVQIIKQRLVNPMDMEFKVEMKLLTAMMEQELFRLQWHLLESQIRLLIILLQKTCIKIWKSIIFIKLKIIHVF
jgi:hypothetical protein